MSTTAPPPNDPSYCDRNAAATATIVLNTFFFTLATVVVALRLYTRRFVTKSLWWDDAVMVAAWVLEVASYAMEMRFIALGIGVRSDCLPFDEVVELVKLGYIETMPLIASGVCARISIALFAIRIFGVSRPLKIFIYSWTVFMVLSYAAVLFLLFLRCIPAAGLWDPRVDAKCWPLKGQLALQDYNGAVSIASDVLLALLPVYFLWRLNMRLKIRILVSSLFAVGLLPAVCAICRTATSYTVATSDVSRDSAILDVFSSIEITTLIICGCLPALSHYVPKDKSGGMNGQRQFQNRDHRNHIRVGPNKVRDPYPLVSLEPFETESRSAPTSSGNAKTSDDGLDSWNESSGRYEC